MAQLDRPVSLQACAMRVARLAADGSTPAGTSNGFILDSGATGGLIKMTFTPQYLAGQDFNARDACGGLSLNFKDRDVLRWYDVALEIGPPDPELEELLTATPIYTGTLQAARTVTDGATTSGSPIINSPTGAFTGYDVGGAVTGTGIPGGATIISVQSSSRATLSANATATATGVSLTITPPSVSVGSESLALGATLADPGVSIELWTKAMIQTHLAGRAPYFHWAFPSVTLQRSGVLGFENAPQTQNFTGLAGENPLWGNGPWNDWLLAPGASPPSSGSLTKAWGRFRSNDKPVGQYGYATVPAQT